MKPIFHLIFSICIVALFPTKLLSAEISKLPPGAELTARSCLICHGNNIRGQRRLAPPFAMVKQHYQSLGEAKFIAAVGSWAKEPHPEKSRMRGAIRQFGLMPPLPLPDADLTAIAKYIFNTEFEMPGRGGKSLRHGPQTSRSKTSAVPSSDE